MRARIPVTVVNLANGRRRDFESLAAAASFTGTSSSFITYMLRDRRAWGKWFIYRQGLDEQYAEIVSAMMAYYKRNGPLKQSKVVETDLVSLRIDIHTVIMVPRYKATEKYAQKYRERLEKARK